MEGQEWMGRGEGGLEEKNLKTLPEQQSSGGEEAFYNGALAAYPQR